MLVTAGPLTTGTVIGVTMYGIWISGPLVVPRPALYVEICVVASAASLFAKWTVPVTPAPKNVGWLFRNAFWPAPEPTE